MHYNKTLNVLKLPNNSNIFFCLSSRTEFLSFVSSELSSSSKDDESLSSSLTVAYNKTQISYITDKML